MKIDRWTERFPRLLLDFNIVLQTDVDSNGRVYRLGLIDRQATEDYSGDSLHNYLMRLHDEVPWLPVVSGESIEDVDNQMLAILNQIKNDDYEYRHWRTDVFSVMFSFCSCYAASRNMSEHYFFMSQLNENPSYLISGD